MTDVTVIGSPTWTKRDMYPTTPLRRHSHYYYCSLSAFFRWHPVCNFFFFPSKGTFGVRRGFRYLISELFFFFFVAFYVVSKRPMTNLVYTIREKSVNDLYGNEFFFLCICIKDIFTLDKCFRTQKDLTGFSRFRNIAKKKKNCIVLCNCYEITKI